MIVPIFVLCKCTRSFIFAVQSTATRRRIFIHLLSKQHLLRRAMARHTANTDTLDGFFLAQETATEAANSSDEEFADEEDFVDFSDNNIFSAKASHVESNPIKHKCGESPIIAQLWQLKCKQANSATLNITQTHSLACQQS